jgi:Transglycosylase SLT domain
MMQLMPGTAADLGVRDRFNPIVNIEAGTRYLRQMIDSTGNVRLGVAAYNAGLRSVRRAGGVPNNGETPTYVSRVLGYWSATPGQNPTSVAVTQSPAPNPTDVAVPAPASLPQPGIQMISFGETRIASLANAHQFRFAAK